MYIREISYKDYNGNERKKNFYFNLTTAELIEMELSADGGFDQYIARIANAQKTPEIVKVFKELITKSYGEKSDDGESFIKIDPKTGRPLCEAFEQTAAYSALFTELITNTDAASEFINQVIPPDAAEAFAKAKTEGTVVSLVEDNK